MKLLKEFYAVCRFSSNESIPTWINQRNFYSITKTSEELSIVCTQEEVPDGVVHEKDWRILKVEGPLDFSLVGILASISTVLANNKVSIFAISTYDTDYILVKQKDIESAVIALSKENYVIKQ